ncbi:MAG: 4Fe-4S binding protein [Treponema sp.]|nr:4Fe-4S binding protein [Treponema sp.]
MILSTILLIIVILIVAILLMFLFYILFPSIHNQNKIKEDPILSNSEIEYINPIKQKVEKSDMRAIVLCSCEKKFDMTRDIFNESYSCAMVNEYSGTGTPCKFACIGLGDCKKSCPQQAVYIKNRTAVISNLCTGCGKCVDVCPLHIIRLIPKNTNEYTLCANKSDEKSGCSEELKTQKVVWNEKKHFKIWATCYRIFNRIIKS